MKQSKMALFLMLITGFILMTAHFAFAGVRMVQENSANGRKTQMSRYIDSSKVRFDTDGEKGKQTIIYRVDKDAFWVINHTDKTYLEITREDMRKIKQMMDMMKKQMDQMPPEKRAQVEKMMKQKMGDKMEKIKYKKVKSGIKVNQWTCDQYEGYSGSLKKSELWTTSFSSVGLNINDFSVLKKMSEFFSEMAGGFINRDMFRSDIIPGQKKTADDFSGVPVKGQFYKDGAMVSSMEIKEIKRENLSPSLFELPAGYTKKKLGERKGAM